jgi:hypothetical protein
MTQQPNPSLSNQGKNSPHPNASRNPSRPSTWDLISQTVMVLFTNTVPLYGVVKLGWNAFILVLLFILEAIVVLFADAVKTFSSKILRRDKKSILFFEGVFILFFGFFAFLVFGPSDMGAFSFAEKFHLVKSLYSTQFRVPLLIMIGFRLLRLVQDLIAGGMFGSRFFRRPLEQSGGGWMLLLCFAVFMAPFVTKTGPSAFGGLVALVVLKIMGETFGVWAVRIVFPKKPKAVR